MKVIRHHRKFIEPVFLLPPIVKENINEELRHPIRLQNAPLLKRRSGDEVTSVSGGPAKWGSHKTPRRLKAVHLF